MNDAELRSLDRLCSKDDLSDSNVASLTVLGLAAVREIQLLRSRLEEACEIALSWTGSDTEDGQRIAALRKAGTP